MRTAPSAFQFPEVLADGKVRRAIRAPVDGFRIDLAALPVEHAHVHALDITLVLAHPGDDVLLHDRQRHRPGRVEVDSGDVGRQRRRRPVRLADHHHVAAHDLVAVDRFGERGRQVHHHVALAKGEIHRGEPIERGPQLTQPLAHRHIECGQRLRPNASRFRQAVTRLEAPHPGGQRVVVDVAVGLVGRRSSVMARRRRSSATSGPLDPGASLLLPGGSTGQPPCTSSAV